MVDPQSNPPAGGRSPEEEPTLGSDVDRERVIDLLCEHFAEDRLSLEEFERRVDQVNASRTLDDLQAALAGLAGGGAVLPGPSPDPGASALQRRRPPMPVEGVPGGPVVVDPSLVKERNWIVAVWSGPERKGPWTPARTTVVTAIQGGASLDFREARLGPGVTEVNAFAFMGGIEIIVPPGLQVESNGVAIMAGWETSTEITGVTDPGKPILRISGLSVWGGVEVVVRHPGETARDAKRRRRLARRAERRRLRGG